MADETQMLENEYVWKDPSNSVDPPRINHQVAHVSVLNAAENSLMFAIFQSASRPRGAILKDNDQEVRQLGIPFAAVLLFFGTQKLS